MVNKELLDALVQTLKEMNRDFGKGKVTYVALNVKECDSKGVYGKVERDGHDIRFFRYENNTVTFLSRRRKLKSNGRSMSRLRQRV
jgi:hypothetical protein